MLEQDQPVQWFLTALLVLGSTIWCRDRARRRGHCGLIFGALGFALGLAAVPFTYLITRERTLPDREVDRLLAGSAPPGHERCAGRLEQVSGLDPDRVGDYLAWEVQWRSLRLALLLSFPLLVLGVLYVLNVLFHDLLPTFVQLFEGMCLQLPLPTRILVSLTRGFRSPFGQLALQALCFTAPILIYLLLSRTGYRLPILGGILRRADRIWVLQSMQLCDPGWTELLPAEVAARTGVEPCRRLDLPQGLEPQVLKEWIRRERDLLAGALWMFIPGVVPVLAAVVASVAFLMVALLLPMYQLMGYLS